MRQESVWLNARAISIAICAAAALTSLTVPSRAFAYTLYGGRWYAANSLYYYINSSDWSYTQPTEAGAASWSSATGYKVGLNRTYSNGYENISVTPVNIPTWWIGYADIYPNRYSGYYTYAATRLNRFYLDGNGPNERQHTAAHEFGHSLGMDHFNGNCNLMFDGGFCAIYPRQDDVNGINALYP